LYFRCPAEDGEEVEMGVGTLDDVFLRDEGDMGVRDDGEENNGGEGGMGYGSLLCQPMNRFWSGREVWGVGFGGQVETTGDGGAGVRWERGSRSRRIGEGKE
jgi:hypothetical protein